MKKTPIIILSIVTLILLVAVSNAKSIIYGGTQLKTLSSAPALSGQISQALASTSDGELTMPIYGTDYTLQDTKYFDNSNWVVTTIKPLSNDMNRSVVVLEKQSGVYAVVLGPGSAFPETTSLSMPSSLGHYLKQQGMFYAATD
jgi:hypothetical protein